MKFSWSAVAAVAVVLWSATTAWAQVTWHVDNNAADNATAGYAPPAGTPAGQIKTVIQDAVNAAANGDTVLVYPGTYTSTNSEVVNLLGKAITLQAAVVYDVNVVATWATIDGQDARRCIVATLNETNQTVVRGLRISRGRASAGGGMYVVNGSPRIEDCWFANNVATGGVASGGALRLLNSVSMIDGCFFEGNSASAEGGAIFNAGGAIMVSGCDFTRNFAVRGGGLFTREDAATISACVFRDYAVSGSCCVSSVFGLGAYALDSAASFLGCEFRDMSHTETGCGGCGIDGVGLGLFVLGAQSDVRVADCDFINLRANQNGRGGAIALGWPGNNRGTLRIFKSTFRGNSASIDGGAIAMQSTDLLQIDGEGGVPTVFENNSANRYGGAISVNVDWVDSGTLLLDEGRFRNNAAGSAGGAIWIRQTGGSGSRVLTDSVFTTNSAVNGGALYLEGSAIRSQLGRTVYCGNDPNDVQGAYLESDPNCFTTSCADTDPHNGVPDTCERPITDCNSDGIADDEQLVNNDVNNDRIPDDCQTRYLDFAGLESELVPVDMTGISAGNYLPASALCWRVYAKTLHPEASVICVYGNSERTLSVSAPGGFYQDGGGGDTVESIACSPTGLLKYDSFFTIEAQCAPQVELQTQNLATPFYYFNYYGNFSTNNGAYFVTPGAAGSQAGPDNRILLMQITTYQAVKPTASINLLGRHHQPDPNNQWFEWQAYGLPIPDPVLVDCNNNGIHDSIEIASGLVADADRNGRPDNCQQCRGDVDRNGSVDIDDLIEIFVAWGDPNPGDADLNNDGIVNAIDLAQVISGWGSCLAP
jgi:predicted outer membrane repeat protein